MYEEDGQWEEKKETSQGMRTKIGIVLIVIGGLILLYLLFQVISILFKNAEPPLVGKLKPVAERITEEVQETEPFELSPGLYKLAGFVLSLFLLGLAVQIGIGFLRGGISLLQPDFTKWLQKATLKMDQMKR